MSNSRIIIAATLGAALVGGLGWYFGAKTAEAPVIIENQLTDEIASTTNDTAATSTNTTAVAPEDTPLQKQVSTSPTKQTSVPVTTTPKPPVTSTPKPATALVTYNGRGFSPDELTIVKGDTVRFLNTSDDDMWIIADLHPTHKNYPEKTTSGCSPTIFDMCKAVGNGQYWDFTFNYEGTFGYHNESKPVMNGKIEVNLPGEKPATTGIY